MKEKWQRCLIVEESNVAQCFKGTLNNLSARKAEGFILIENIKTAKAESEKP